MKVKALRFRVPGFIGVIFGVYIARMENTMETTV